MLPREQFELMLEYAVRSDYARNPRDSGSPLIRRILESRFDREQVPDTHVTART
jgi:hypothetical protein